MKRLLECADSYIQSRDCTMLAGLKFCLSALGVLLGLFIPKKHKKCAAVGALAVFLATYIPLMADFLIFAADFFVPGAEECE